MLNLYFSRAATANAGSATSGRVKNGSYGAVVAPFLISQCYNNRYRRFYRFGVVAPFLISQCYNAYFFR